MPTMTKTPTKMRFDTAGTPKITDQTNMARGMEMKISNRPASVMQTEPVCRIRTTATTKSERPANAIPPQSTPITSHSP